MTTEISKTRKIIGWIIASLLTALYLFSAASKLIIYPEQMGQMHLSSWSIIIPIGEIISAVLFLIPKTNIYGTLLLSAYMGGAIIINMTNGLSIATDTVVILLVWFVGFLRNPELIKK